MLGYGTHGHPHVLYVDAGWNILGLADADFASEAGSPRPVFGLQAQALPEIVRGTVTTVIK